MVMKWGVDLRLEMYLPNNEGFRLDQSVLDGPDTLGPSGIWTDVLCDVTALDSSRGDFAIDQRPNCALETGTLTAEVVNMGSLWLPDDLSLILGMGRTGLHGGTRIRLMATVDGQDVPIFAGKIVSYDGEWLSGAQLVTIEAVDHVADIAAINPAAQPLPVGFMDQVDDVFSRLSTLAPDNIRTLWRNDPRPWYPIFRDDTYGDPLRPMYQKWGDTSLAHLGMRVNGYPGVIYDQWYPLLMAWTPTADGVVQDPLHPVWTMVDCALPQPEGAIPLHWARMRVDSALVVNDCLSSADRPTEYRWRYSAIGNIGEGQYRLWRFWQSDQTWDYALAIHRKDQAGFDRWPEFSGMTTGSELNVRISTPSQEATGDWRFQVYGGPPTLQPGDYIHFGGLEPGEANSQIPFQWQPSTVGTISRMDTSIVPDDARAQRTIDYPSVAYHGTQDYRRLDLPLVNDKEALSWGQTVVAYAKRKGTYIDQVEVHLHREDPAAMAAIGIDVLDKMIVRKAFPEYGGQVVEFLGAVVGVADRMDSTQWIRTFTLSPLGEPVVVTP